MARLINCIQHVCVLGIAFRSIRILNSGIFFVWFFPTPVIRIGDIPKEQRNDKCINRKWCLLRHTTKPTFEANKLSVFSIRAAFDHQRATRDAMRGDKYVAGLLISCSIGWRHLYSLGRIVCLLLSIVAALHACSCKRGRSCRCHKLCV